MCKKGAMMKKLKILYDANDTIENLAMHRIAELNKKYNKTVNPQKRYFFDMCMSFPDLSALQVLEPLYNDLFGDKITPIMSSEHYFYRQ